MLIRYAVWLLDVLACHTVYTGWPLWLSRLSLLANLSGCAGYTSRISCLCSSVLLAAKSVYGGWICLLRRLATLLGFAGWHAMMCMPSCLLCKLVMLAKTAGSAVLYLLAILTGNAVLYIGTLCWLAMLDMLSGCKLLRSLGRQVRFASWLAMLADYARCPAILAC
jgi:hypothetical protein